MIRLLEIPTLDTQYSKYSILESFEGGHGDDQRSLIRKRAQPGGPPYKREALAAAYLRAAHAYMLISMPTGTSTIFGVFQAILALLAKPDELRPADKVIGNEKFASEIFRLKTQRFPWCDAKEIHGIVRLASNQSWINRFIVGGNHPGADPGLASSGGVG
jgi:hypothetical protein